MRLTDYTDYALRVLLYLSVRPAGLSTIQEISDAYGISKNHLMKIVQQLGELGWVETVRGRNGGLRLAEHSGALTVGEIVRKTENDFAIVGCFGPADEGQTGHKGCVIQSHCRLQGVFAAARDAFLAELDKHTIGELAHPSNELARLLNIPNLAPLPAGEFIPIRDSSLNET
ncbi:MULTISPECIES: Rrf2 family transcriptional regulator [unclassified Caballeronia]|uniref:Rrf2 family transcriptional regulator n=1 Tax=unclassified Caballeronia TaxID=2646786 RepID=UPI00285BB9C7|nr:MULTISPECIES: Rrf2 family transcriptional regulator [unclassified Caballeronia]MDR5813664.1 Rrf2 family transcriptional regulator [Caballeronia sp. LZ033]MDR5820420.1 Rrf2 family transcriptional regulator [Caballeronia sp. LZ043]MDR5878237.1 Rrf2 family transcriptional regulator [Caballeronia sp. LZ032]